MRLWAVSARPWASSGGLGRATLSPSAVVPSLRPVGHAQHLGGLKTGLAAERGAVSEMVKLDLASLLGDLHVPTGGEPPGVGDRCPNRERARRSLLPPPPSLRRLNGWQSRWLTRWKGLIALRSYDPAGDSIRQSFAMFAI